MAFAETQHLAVQIDLKGNLTSGINKTQRQLQGLEKSFGRVGKGAGQLSAGVARAGVAVAAAAGTGLVAVAKAAIDFEEAFTGIKKTVNDATTEQFATLQRAIRDMATEIPIAATELARLGEVGGALGIKTDAIDEFVRTTALLGETTDLTADAAAEALGKIGNILNLTADDYDNFGSALVRLGNTGASTEPEIIEIAKRFAGAGKSAGLAGKDILGFAEAVASFTGLAPEAAGSSLSRLTNGLINVAAKGGEKYKLLNKIVGTDFRKALDKDARGALVRFIKGFSKLDKYEKRSALKTLGINSVYLGQLMDGLAGNVDGLDKSLANADAGWAGNFLNQEAEKKFASTKSKLTLLKNGFTEAAITIGEGFTPALGRAADKLGTFLKAPENRKALTELGKDIGKSIDSIDWNEVLKGARSLLGVMKSAFGWAKRIYDVFNALPTEIKGAAAGLLILNKASGGLIGSGIGNIAGGLGETIARTIGSQLPGALGRAFVQPVFVTNFPLGLGGPGGGIPPVMPPGAVVPRIGAGIAIEQNPALIKRVAADAKAQADRNAGRIIATVRDTGAKGEREQRNAIAKAREIASRTKDVDSSVDAGTVRTSSAARDAGRHTASTISAAIRANRPSISTKVTVNVTAGSVQRSVTTQNRYGPANGSSGRDSRDRGGGGV